MGTKDSIKLFEELISPNSNKRDSRRLELLKDPQTDSPDTWRLFIPRAFNSALDIALTQRIINSKDNRKIAQEWTQGSAFSFSSGDILYDTKDAYLDWSNAIKKVRLCFEVISATSASPQQREKPRFPGSLTIKVCRPNSNLTRLEEAGRAELTQDEFVRFILGGDCDQLTPLVG